MCPALVHSVSALNAASPRTCQADQDLRLPTITTRDELELCTLTQQLLSPDCLVVRPIHPRNSSPSVKGTAEHLRRRALLFPPPGLELQSKEERIHQSLSDITNVNHTTRCRCLQRAGTTLLSRHTGKLSRHANRRIRCTGPEFAPLRHHDRCACTDTA